MENQTIDDSYRKAKKKARKLYETIGRVWCPTLGEYIAFNETGFRHLVRKSGKRRPLSDQNRRFSLLPLVQRIIQDPEIKIIYCRRKTVTRVGHHGQKILWKSYAHFWKLTKKDNDITVTVIIRQMETNEKHFFSVYDKKSKNRHATVI